MEQKVSIDQLKTAVTTKDLITDLPKDCKVYSGEVSVVAANGLHSFAFMADSVGQFIRTHLPNPKKGNKIIIAISTSSCFGKKAREYKLVVE